MALVRWGLQRDLDYDARDRGDRVADSSRFHALLNDCDVPSKRIEPATL